MWRFSDEALRVGAEGTIESFLACRVDRIDLAVMDLVRRHEAEAGMMVIPIVPVEKAPGRSRAPIFIESWIDPAFNPQPASFDRM